MGSDEIKFPLKFVEDDSLSYDDVTESENCPEQGYFYSSIADEEPENDPDWDEEEFEDYEEEDYGNDYDEEGNEEGKY